MKPTLLLILLHASTAQYYEGSPQYEQQQVIGEQDLVDELESHPSLSDQHPSSSASWRTAYPRREDYTIGLHINPCGANGTFGGVGGKALGYDCCMNHYGQGEYGFIKKQEYGPGGQPFIRGLRVSPWHEITGPDEVLHNMYIVDEDGDAIPYEHSRRADDVTVIDETCFGFRNPYPYCVDNLLRAVKSVLIPPCSDNNQTVDATLDCYAPDGKRMPHCMQVAYSQTALIHICGGEFADDPRCGTFIEIHRPNGSPYDEENVVLADIKITTRVVDGMVTTTVPLTYKGDPNRILCNYQETKIRVGSMVKIKSHSAICCCPPLYSKKRKQGSFFCPRRPFSRDGPLATTPKTKQEQIEVEEHESTYPYCRSDDDNKDLLMCSKRLSSAFSFTTHDAFTYLCSEAVLGEDGMYGSDDLTGRYTQGCPIGEAFTACATAPMDDKEDCPINDNPVTFRGEIGKVVGVHGDDDGTEKGVYGVTFNDDRTSYSFAGHELELIHLDNTYDVWFVQRNRFENIIKKKKSFRVIHPPCSYDAVNDRYFPYAQLDDSGVPMPVVAEYDGVIEES